MTRIKHQIFLDPNYVLEHLKQKGLIEFVRSGEHCIAGRYGTNKKTLKKILYDYLKAQGGLS